MVDLYQYKDYRVDLIKLINCLLFFSKLKDTNLELIIQFTKLYLMDYHSLVTTGFLVTMLMLKPDVKFGIGAYSVVINIHFYAQMERFSIRLVF